MKRKKIFYGLSLAALLFTSISCDTSGFRSKEVDFYLGTLENTLKVKLYFNDSKYRGIPYINVTEDGKNLLNKLFSEYKGYKVDTKIEDKKITLTRENKAEVVFDSDNDTIYSKDFNLFKIEPFAVNGLDLNSIDYRVFKEDGTIDTNKSRFTITPSNISPIYHSGKSITIDLKEYNIDIVKSGNNFYVPFTTFYNTCGNPFGSVSYNGEALFLCVGAFDETTEAQKNYKNKYYSNTSNEKPDALIQYNYNELCRDLDYGYGLKDTHGIDKFDDYFKQIGIKDLMFKGTIETKGATYCAESLAMNYLQFVYLGDSHTSYGFGSPYLNDIHKLTMQEYGMLTSFGVYPINPNMYNRALDSVSRNNVRLNSGVVKKVEQGTINEKTVISNPLNVVGENNDKSMIITFDSFIFNPNRDFYYSDEFKNDKAKYIYNESNNTIDIVALTSLANDKLKADKDIKRIIIDDSCNSGGMISAVIFLLSWLDCGKVMVEDPISGAKAINPYISDVNFDGKFDMSDTIYYDSSELTAKKRDIDVYCLTSCQSFSCGNLLPAMIQYNKKGKLIGTQSGGGACAVHVSTTGDGSGFNYSSNYRLCVEDNGSFYNIDRGVKPDFEVNKLDTLYGGDTSGNYKNLIEYIKNLK